jgi:hypothetical protein
MKFSLFSSVFFLKRVHGEGGFRSRGRLFGEYKKYIDTADKIHYNSDCKYSSDNLRKAFLGGIDSWL